MGTFVSRQTFLDNVLPDYLKGKDQLTVLLSTYNSVGLESDGEKETGKPGLRVIVQSGNVNYDPRVEGALLASCLSSPFDPNMRDLGREASRVMEVTAAAAEDRVVGKYDAAKGDLRSSDNLLVVVYSGLTGFAKTNEFVKQLRADQPHASIFVVTCDCDDRNKREVYTPLLASGEIAGVIFIKDCGGRGSMETIMNRVIELWPAA